MLIFFPLSDIKINEKSEVKGMFLKKVSPSSAGSAETFFKNSQKRTFDN